MAPLRLRQVDSTQFSPLQVMGPDPRYDHSPSPYAPGSLPSLKSGWVNDDPVTLRDWRNTQQPEPTRCHRTSCFDFPKLVKDSLPGHFGANGLQGTLAWLLPRTAEFAHSHVVDVAHVE